MSILISLPGTMRGKFLCRELHRWSHCLSALTNNNPKLDRALELLESNDIEGALRIGIDEYKKELESLDLKLVFTRSRSSDGITRPSFHFLREMIGSLGPTHPAGIAALAEIQQLSEEATPFKPRVIKKRHGGYPVRLNNGKWTWQGPHWSRTNNRTWKTGYASDLTFGWGK